MFSSGQKGDVQATVSSVSSGNARPSWVDEKGSVRALPPSSRDGRVAAANR